MQASMGGGAVHSYGAPLVLIRSVIGQNSDPWIKVDSGVESRGLIILDTSILMASPTTVCGGLSIPVPNLTATPVGLALKRSEALAHNSRSEALAHNSSINPLTQYDATSYLVHSQSSYLVSHASQDQAISLEALYAPLN